MSCKYSMNKDVNEVVKWAIKLGFTFEQGKKHSKLRAPNGEFHPVSFTPSDTNTGRWLKRDLTNMARRCGLPV